jgi:hypothetical protein
MRSTTSLVSSADLKASIRSTFPVIVTIVKRLLVSSFGPLSPLQL